MIHLRQIEVFYAIMRAGSVTDAARILSVTQPAVSASLKQLENRLRMRLFDRTGGRLEPRIGLRSLLLRPLKGAQSQVARDFIAELRLGFA